MNIKKEMVGNFTRMGMIVFNFVSCSRILGHSNLSSTVRYTHPDNCDGELFNDIIMYASNKMSADEFWGKYGDFFDVYEKNHLQSVKFHPNSNNE